MVTNGAGVYRVTFIDKENGVITVENVEPERPERPPPTGSQEVWHAYYYANGRVVRELQVSGGAARGHIAPRVMSRVEPLAEDFSWMLRIGLDPPQHRVTAFNLVRDDGRPYTHLADRDGIEYRYREVMHQTGGRIIKKKPASVEEAGPPPNPEWGEYSP